MTLHFILGKSMCNCYIQVKDEDGIKNYRIPATTEDENAVNSLDIDIYGKEFDITLVPDVPDYGVAINELECDDWKDRLAKKAAKSLFSFAEKMFLRVGCTYRISGTCNGDIVYINEQEYVFGTHDSLDILELIPIMYTYFEIHIGEERFELTDAFGINRREVIGFAKKISLLDFGPHIAVTYPFQVGRIKYLTKNKKIFRILYRFHNMSSEKRQQILDRQNKFFDS